MFLAVDAGGNVFVADGYNQVVRKITPAGVVSTVAGKAGQWGAADGAAETARFAGPVGVALDRSGNLFVTEAGNGTVRKITPEGMVSTVSRSFKWPWGITVDPDGTLFVADLGYHVVSKITPSGAVTILAGVRGRVGSTDGVGSGATFNRPTGVTLDQAGNLLVSDSSNSVIRKVVLVAP